MENILNQFGIEPTLLLAQIVNFCLLLFLLNKFLYKPILKVLNERKQKIAQSLKDSERITQELEKTEKDRQIKLAKAIQESRQIIEDATKQAQEIIDQAHLKAQEETKAIVARSREEMASEGKLLRQEIRSELANLIVLATEKVTSSLLDRKSAESLTKKVIKDL